jgi:hypothetical protein
MGVLKRPGSVLLEFSRASYVESLRVGLGSSLPESVVVRLLREECVQVLAMLTVYVECLDRAGVLADPEYAWAGSAAGLFGHEVLEAVRREHDGR